MFVLGLTQAHSHNLLGGVYLSDFSSGGPLVLPLPFLLTCLQDDHDPIIFTILDCPCRSKWKVTDSINLLEHLGTDTLQFYDIELKIWVEVPVLYPHTMMTDGYLLL